MRNDRSALKDGEKERKNKRTMEKVSRKPKKEKRRIETVEWDSVEKRQDSGECERNESKEYKK